MNWERDIEEDRDNDNDSWSLFPVIVVMLVSFALGCTVGIVIWK